MQQRITTLLCGLIVVAGIVGMVLWFEPTRIGYGWLRGESFHEGRPTSYWRKAIVTEDEPTITTRLGNEAAVPVLVEVLRDEPQPLVRARAAALLSKLGPKAKAAVPALLEAIKDEDGTIDPAIINSLRTVVKFRKEHPDAAIELENFSNAEAARFAAAEALMEIDPEAAKQAGLP
ncbi:MAG: HEAT repeat domain-containing protein [Gemmataceae bacterium]|nr:HEAT repeat domain-containing protein [Gemmataceae bacterium]